jgi:hypothetical protein
VITLSWTASTDNVGVTGYIVSRGGTPIATLGNVTSYQDTGLSPSTSYSYSVKAKDAAGNLSVASNTAPATTSAASSTAWPGPDNTGVPAGTILTPSGAITATVAGAVYVGLDIVGKVTVNAPNVTFRNCRIRGNTMWLVENNSTGLLIEDSEIINRPVAGQNNCHNGIGNDNFTLRRTEITGCENAVNIDNPGNVTITDNYFHDLDTSGPSYVWGNEPHTDGIQVGSGASNLVIRHNWIDPSPGGGVTSGIIMYVGSSQPPNSSVWIEDNYIDGSGASYAIYAPRVQVSNIFINRNQMLKGYGYVGCVKVGITVTTFDDNKDANTGALISPDNGAAGSCTN